MDNLFGRSWDENHYSYPFLEYYSKQSLDVWFKETLSQNLRRLYGFWRWFPGPKSLGSVHDTKDIKLGQMTNFLVMFDAVDSVDCFVKIFISLYFLTLLRNATWK